MSYIVFEEIPMDIGSFFVFLLKKKCHKIARIFTGISSKTMI